MALSAATVWEVRTAGNDTNGGGFVTGAGGTDYSQQDAKNTAGSNISTTDAVANGTTTITSATAAFTSAIVGNIIYFAGGTGAITGVWRQVTAFTNATTITIDASIAASTGMTMNIGGALASPGQAGFSHIAGNTIWVQAGTYTVTSASTNVTAGCVSLAAATSDSVVTSIQGYGTSRGDYGTKPVMKADGVITSFTLITLSTADVVANLEVDGNSRATSRGVISAGANGMLIYACTLKNFTNNAVAGISSQQRGRCILSRITGCSTQVAVLNTHCFGCVAHDNTVTAFSATVPGIHWVDTIADTNTGATTDGFAFTEYGVVAENCVAYANGRDGFRVPTGNSAVTMINCIAEGNVNGFNWQSTAAITPSLFNCAAYNNSTANYAASIAAEMKINCLTLTGSPFVDAANQNFGLNTTSGAGGAVRGQALPGTFPGIPTVGHGDIGVAQSASSGGSGFILGG